MTSHGDRLSRAVAAIDEANAEDPRVVVGGDGPVPKELAHSRAMTGWVLRLDPRATEEQLVAARAHHFRRWTRPRSAFPEGRSGYLRWRREARRSHALEVGGLLEPLGYSSSQITRICSLIEKTAPMTDPHMQTHEDALCLVFLEAQAGATAETLGPDRARSVLSKTLAKMSPDARRRACELNLGDVSDLVAELCPTIDDR